MGWIGLDGDNGEDGRRRVYLYTEKAPATGTLGACVCGGWGVVVEGRASSAK